MMKGNEIDISDLFQFGEIRCEVETPQHKNGKVHKMLRQIGVFRLSTMEFEAGSINGINGHNVYFGSVESFQNYLIRVFK